MGTGLTDNHQFLTRKLPATTSFVFWEQTIGAKQKGRLTMFRILRFALLGLVFAVPFAMPQASQAAAPVGVIRCRPCYAVPRYQGRNYFLFWHGHRLIRQLTADRDPPRALTLGGHFS